MEGNTEEARKIPPPLLVYPFSSGEREREIGIWALKLALQGRVWEIAAKGENLAAAPPSIIETSL